VTYVLDRRIPNLILLAFKFIRNLYYNLYKSATNYRFASVSLTHERTSVVMTRFYLGYSPLTLKNAELHSHSLLTGPICYLEMCRPYML